MAMRSWPRWAIPRLASADARASPWRWPMHALMQELADGEKREGRPRTVRDRPTRAGEGFARVPRRLFERREATRIRLDCERDPERFSSRSESAAPRRRRRSLLTARDP